MQNCFGGLRGAARESAFRGSKQTRSSADAQAIEAAIASGGLLLAKEHTHLAVIRNARGSAIIPLYASGTAKVKGHDGTAGDQAWMLEKLEEVWVLNIFVKEPFLKNMQSTEKAASVLFGKTSPSRL